MKTKKEAAEYLGVSARTVERYVKARRLTLHYEKGKRRPIAVYDEAELEVLRRQIQERHDGGTASATALDGAETMQRIGFRLDPYYLKKLAEDGAKIGLSPGEYARSLVVGALEDFRYATLLAEIEALREGLASLSGPGSAGGMSAAESEAGATVRKELAALGRDLTQATRQAGAAVRKDVAELRRLLADATEAVLLNLSDDQDRAQIKKWVAANLRG